MKKLIQKNFILINARITRKSFKRWKLFPSFSKEVFKNYHCLTSKSRNKNYLKKLGVKNIKLIGNLKYFKNDKEGLKKNIKKYFKKRKVFCAASTIK